MLKRWLIALAALVFAGVFLLPQVAADMDFFFSHQLDKLSWNPVDGWAALVSGGKSLAFYCLLLALTALLLLWILLSGSYLKYRSDMRRVTPDILTPCAAGQGQYGTARWLGRKELRRCFGVWRIPTGDPQFSALLAAGQSDKEAIDRGA